MDNGVEALVGFVGMHGDAAQSAPATFARLVRRAAL
jgi:hypothetical protein